ncbi:hypothetical protein ACFS07_15815 [Undibacterium arcticum]|uniref:Uncharacterized protein n=2 Tax=Undibacterium arcticum TaxID=1762892 RepID=A0ABV7F5E1_9BURK
MADALLDSEALTFIADGLKGANDMVCARQLYDAASRVERASHLKRASALARELEISIEEFSRLSRRWSPDSEKSHTGSRKNDKDLDFRSYANEVWRARWDSNTTAFEIPAVKRGYNPLHVRFDRADSATQARYRS